MVQLVFGDTFTSTWIALCQKIIYQTTKVLEYLIVRLDSRSVRRSIKAEGSRSENDDKCSDPCIRTL